MNLDVYQEIIDRSSSLKAVKKYLTQLLGYNKFCHKLLGSGSSGNIYSISYPKPIRFKYEDGNILEFNNFVAKFSIENGPVKINIKKGKLYFITNENPIGEAIVSMILSSLFFKGITPHITCCLGFSVCNENNESVTEIFYEPLIVKLPNKNDEYISDSKGFITNLTELPIYFKSIGLTQQPQKLETAIDSMLIALFHTMFTLQYNFNLIHFDLYVRNIFMKVFDNSPYFMGNNMNTFKYFCYKFPNKINLYIENPGFIIKIGDFGLCMMSITDKIIFENNNTTNQSEKILKKYYPNYPNVKKFIPDYIFIIRSFAYMFGLASSRLLTKLLLKIPALSNVDDISLDILNGYFDYDAEKILSIQEIVEKKDIFNHSIPSDATNNNTLIINYK